MDRCDEVDGARRGTNYFKFGSTKAGVFQRVCKPNFRVMISRGR